jgi:hypothetical protein
MRQLVLPDRHQPGLAEQDVGGLVRRIGEHQAADGGLPGLCDLVLDGGVAAEFGDRDQAEEGQQQLVEGGDRAVGEDRAAVRVDADGEIVQHQPFDVFAEPVGDVAVGQHLVVSDHHHQLGALLLQPDPVLQGAEVVADVQRPGGSVAGEDAGGRGGGCAGGGSGVHGWPPGCRRGWRRGVCVDGGPPPGLSGRGMRKGRPRERPFSSCVRGKWPLLGGAPPAQATGRRTMHSTRLPGATGSWRQGPPVVRARHWSSTSTPGEAAGPWGSRRWR